VTNKKTLYRLTKHLEIIAVKNYSDENEEETILNPKRRNITLPLLIVGNKSDLESNKYKKKQDVRQYLDQVFGKDQNTNCIFVSNKMDETELREIDNFIEDSIAGNFHNLMLYNTAKQMDSQKNFTRQQLSSLSESAEALFSTALTASRWIFRKIKSLTRKNNREELII